MVFSHLSNSLQQIIVIVIIVNLNINKVFTDDRIGNTKPYSTKQSDPVKSLPFEEYFIEHNISQTDAKKSFNDVGVKLLSDKAIPSYCAATPCTEKIMNYCLNGQMLHDHCCCDSRHGREELPWIPHSCYVGESCHPIIRSCILYTEYKQCCCDRALAKRWKNIYSISSKITSSRFFHLVWITVIAFSWSNICCFE